MSVQDSFTDFHIDLGGTCVWYHIFKVFSTLSFIFSNELNFLFQHHKVHPPCQQRLRPPTMPTTTSSTHHANNDFVHPPCQQRLCNHCCFNSQPSLISFTTSPSSFSHTCRTPTPFTAVTHHNSIFHALIVITAGRKNILPHQTYPFKPCFV